MRDLAAAAGLNVASLYHYFNSKRDLLVAVLAERGFLDEMVANAPSDPDIPRPTLNRLLSDIFASMLEVEDFIRLMMGEVMRGDETAFAVGTELFDTTQHSLEHWIEAEQPELAARGGAPAVARLLRAAIVGLFFEHVAGVLSDGEDASPAFERRAAEIAEILGGGA
jgi:AcrR family transcriptional regulator